MRSATIIILPVIARPTAWTDPPRSLYIDTKPSSDRKNVVDFDRARLKREVNTTVEMKLAAYPFDTYRPLCSS